MKNNVVIVGGGIIGLSSAYYLAKGGASVILLEKNHLGFGASGSSAAMLECQVDAHRGEPFLSLARSSLQLFPELSKDIFDLTQIDFQYERGGILQVAVTEDDASFLKSEVKRQRKLKMSAEWMEPDPLRKEFPQMNPEHFGGAFFKDDGQLNGEKFLTSMAQASRTLGVKIYENIGDWEFIIDDRRVRGIKTFRGDFLADQFVFCLGAWTDVVLKFLGVQFGIKPLRGQLLVYDTPSRILKCPLYTRSNGYIAPKESFTFAGTTVEDVGFLNTITQEAKEDLRKKAVALLPPLSRTPIRGMTAGLRPVSPDLLPVIGALTDFPNLTVATGHYRNGILLAPITGQLVREIIFEEKSKIDLKPFSPTRFSAKR